MSGDNRPPRKVKKLQNIELDYYALVHLFKFLVTSDGSKKSLINAAQVCKNRKEAAYAACLWKGSVLGLKNQPISEKTATSLLQRNITVVEIDSHTVGSQTLQRLSDIAQIQVLIVRYGIAVSFKSFPSLQSLSLGHPRGFNFIALINLRQLQISSKALSDYDIGSNDLTVVFNSLPNLKDLEVANIGQGFNSCELSKADCYPSLERLILHGTELELGQLTDGVSTYFPNLKHLSIELRECGYDYTAADICHPFTELESFSPNSTTHVEWILGNLDHVLKTSMLLTALDMSCAVPGLFVGVDDPPLGLDALSSITDEHIDLIFRNLPALKVFNIFRHKFSLASFNKVAAYMTNLEVLVLCTTEWWEYETGDEEEDDEVHLNEFLENLEAHWPKLVSLLGLPLQDKHYGHLNNVRYIHEDWMGGVYSYWREQIVRLDFDSQKVVSSKTPISIDSADWHTAVGTKFFKLPDSFSFEFERHDR